MELSNTYRTMPKRSKYVDIDGMPVERTKKDYPYSYDPFVVWKGDFNKEKSLTVYSDHLMNWHYDRYNECALEVWGNTGQYFYNRQPKDIERFLRLYMNKRIKLTAIMEGCNVLSGFPFWIFFYEDTVLMEDICY